MVIQRTGPYAVKLSVSDQVVGINPPSKDSQFKQTKYGCDVALQSLNHPDFNGTDALGSKSKETYVIRGPGEYEINNIFINGFDSYAKYDGVGEQINTIYSLIFDNMRVMYTGPLDRSELSEAIQEDLYQTEILFIPIAGDNVLGADEAFKLAKKFSPRYVVPIGYDEKKNKVDMDAFASLFGDHVTRSDKLTLKRKDLEGEHMDLVILTEQ